VLGTCHPFLKQSHFLPKVSKREIIWPKFKMALAKREWVIYPFFALLVVIFFLLLPVATAARSGWPAT
jgi:hypothetical protein